MNKSKTAILIFANSAEKEIISKSFSSKRLFETLNKHTLNIVKKTGIPYFLFSEKQQTGNSFGERFTNAMQAVYNLGFNTLITIGNDTPHLTSKHILKTVEKLQKHSIVLGPSTDGGFYLMGLKKSQFNKETFLKLPWKTSNLNKSISKLESSKKINISYLELLTDIDDVSDIKWVLDGYKTISTTIKILLLQLFSSVKKIIFYHFITIENFISNLQLNKGSPVLHYL